MAKFCKEVQEWIEEKIEKPFEEFIEKRVEKCKKKKCKWWCACCNKWFCWIETIIEKIIKWVVVTVGKWVTRIVCEVIHIIVDIIGFVVGLIFAIPIIGRLIRQIWDILVEIVHRIIKLPDLLLCFMGVKWRKRLRICIIILRDDKGPTTTQAALQPDIDRAVQIYNDAANIELIIDGVHTVKNKSPDYALDVGCGAKAWWEDLWVVGSYFEWIANTLCFDGVGRRFTGWAAPVVIFCVRSVEGSTAGCSLGGFSDYVTIEGPNPICLAHELGHACGLLHRDSDRENLMHPICGGTKLTRWQRCIIRNSRHVSYL